MKRLQEKERKNEDESERGRKKEVGGQVQLKIKQKSHVSIALTPDWCRLAEKAWKLRFAKGFSSEITHAHSNTSAVMFIYDVQGKLCTIGPESGHSGGNQSPPFHAERRALANLINTCIREKIGGFSIFNASDLLKTTAPLTINEFKHFLSVLINMKIKILIYTERIPCNMPEVPDTCNSFFKTFLENLDHNIIYSVPLMKGDEMEECLARGYMDAREILISLPKQHIPKEKVKETQSIIEKIFRTIQDDEIFSSKENKISREALELFHSRICSYEIIFKNMIKSNSTMENHNTLLRFSLPKTSLPKQSDKSANVSSVKPKIDSSEKPLLFAQPQMQDSKVNCEYQYEDNDIGSMKNRVGNQILAFRIKNRSC